MVGDNASTGTDVAAGVLTALILAVMP